VGKRRAEQSLRALRASHGVRATILRLPIVQGEGDGTLRLWAWLERMLDGGRVPLPDAGERLTRFVHAGDVGRVLLRLLDGPPPREIAYNLAQPDVLPLREFLERVARAAGVMARFVDLPWDELESAGIARSSLPYAGRWVSVLDPSLAAAELGFACSRVDEYLPGVVRWHLENRPARSHSGYAQRALELELAARRTTGATP
jgi:nucleoside-diphosphate-sugar epimerase